MEPIRITSGPPTIIKKEEAYQPVQPVLKNDYLSSQMKQVELSQHWHQQTNCCPSPECLVHQIQVQRPTLAAATNQKPDHT